MKWRYASAKTAKAEYHTGGLRGDSRIFPFAYSNRLDYKLVSSLIKLGLPSHNKVARDRRRIAKITRNFPRQRSERAELNLLRFTGKRPPSSPSPLLYPADLTRSKQARGPRADAPPTHAKKRLQFRLRKYQSAVEWITPGSGWGSYFNSNSACCGFERTGNVGD